MCLPYLSNSCYESDYECICIVINGKTGSVPLNNLSSVILLYISVCFCVYCTRGDEGYISREEMFSLLKPSVDHVCCFVCVDALH